MQIHDSELHRQELEVASKSSIIEEIMKEAQG
jgi:hypothetical protein